MMEPKTDLLMGFCEHHLGAGPRHSLQLTLACGFIIPQWLENSRLLFNPFVLAVSLVWWLAQAPV